MRVCYSVTRFLVLDWEFETFYDPMLLPKNHSFDKITVRSRCVISSLVALACCARRVPNDMRTVLYCVLLNERRYRVGSAPASYSGALVLKCQPTVRHSLLRWFSWVHSGNCCDVAPTVSQTMTSSFQFPFQLLFAWLFYHSGYTCVVLPIGNVLK